MSVIFLVFVIGALNLCLGYALAVWLKYGPTSLREAREGGLAADRPAEAKQRAPSEPPKIPLAELIEELVGSSHDPEAEDQPEIESEFWPAAPVHQEMEAEPEYIAEIELPEQPAVDPHAVSAEDISDEEMDATADDMESTPPTGPDTSVLVGLGEALGLEPATSANLHTCAGLDQRELCGEPAPADTENWELEEKYVEVSLLSLNISMMKSGARATEIDTQLRGPADAIDLQTIKICLAKLKEDCESYLAEQAEMAESFKERISQFGEKSALEEEIDRANLEQVAQIETTINNLTFMDFESDLEAARRRLEEVNNLAIARHKLRDNQEAAFLAAAACENRTETIEKRLYHDGLTRLRNRIGLEATLWRWLQQGRQKSRRMSAVLFDLDRFGTVNEKCGLAVGDRLLAKIAVLLQNAVKETDIVARFAGQSAAV